MQFSYQAYENLLALLQSSGYQQADYWNYTEYRRPVILRHDIDTDIHQALAMAEVEAALGVRACYFVLLRTDFYNPASFSSQKMLQRIHALGHEIGLHFDEGAYPPLTREETIAAITNEAAVLSDLCRFPIRAVSMHRPSKATLEADLQIPGMVNSYGQTFFRDFKYLSDSRHRWREPVEKIIESGTCDRLHILTHPFWYHADEQSIETAVKRFILGANRERYTQMADNITDLTAIVKKEELLP